MIYSKSTYNRIILYLSITAGLLFIALCSLMITEYRQSEVKVREIIPLLLEEAISEGIKLKMENVYVSSHMVFNSTEKKSSFRNQTIITEDTAITKEAEVNGDMERELLKGFQSYLLHINQLQPDTLQQLFDKKMDQNDINARSFILVHHEHDTEMSGDTTGYRINYRTPVIKGGIFEEIAYQGLLNYSPFTVLRLVPKKTIVALLIWEVLIIGILCYLYLQKRKIKPGKIVKKGGYYYIGETILDTRKMELIAGKKNIKVPKQQFAILLMFLDSDDHILLKENLKNHFWSDKHYTANQILMSTINKLRTCLKEIDCTFNVCTKKGDDYYILKYMEENLETKEVDQ